MNETTYWEAVQQRDQKFDGQFVYAVRTTGIYCRPICPSRRPNSTNVEFFADPDHAEQAGYRACQRCEPRAATHTEPQFDLIVQVCDYLEQPHPTLPTLDELAAHFALSPSHLQRTFKRIVGVSPRQYADAHRQNRLKAELKEGNNVTGALYESGYGSSSSFYEQARPSLGMTPILYQNGGKALTIRYTIAPCRLGFVLIGATDEGICKISLGDSETVLGEDLQTEFPAAHIEHAPESFGAWIGSVLAFIDGTASHLDLPLAVQATAFQRKVWDALRAIPYGSTRSYRQIAEQIGQPTAARAVARACATNPAALAIPCHRVVHGNGDRSGYRWGISRKEALLDQEAVAVEEAVAEYV